MVDPLAGLQSLDETTKAKFAQQLLQELPEKTREAVCKEASRVFDPKRGFRNYLKKGDRVFVSPAESNEELPDVFAGRLESVGAGRLVIRRVEDDEDADEGSGVEDLGAAPDGADG